MDVATVVGGASLLTAVGFGLYQLQKQRESDRRRKEMKQRLQRKEELKELSENLQGLRDRISTLSEELIHPRSNEDIDVALYGLRGDVLSYAYAADDNPVVSVDELTFNHSGEEENIILHDVEETVHAHNQNTGRVFLTIHLEESRNLFRYSTRRHLDSGLWGISWVHERLQEIREEHEGLLSQFDSTLIDDVVDSLNRLTIACFEQVFKSYDGVEFDPDDYEGPRELEDAIYAEFFLSEDVYTAIDELEEISERVDEIQKTVIGTSFS